jgi:U3 small nucleolar RNA-associated protein 23
MAAQPINPKTEKPYRPLFLPPPTELPLRHCSHNAEHTPIDEIECLLSLLSPSKDSKKNKEHYILASADPILKKRNANDEQRKYKREDERKEEEAMRRSRALRSQARSIPGVPIIYVKRSVMVLEPMSNPSELVRDGVERGKFRAGLDADPMLGKRKRDGEGEGEGEESVEPKKKRGPKVKGPNPLSMKKPKKRSDAPAPTPKKEKVNMDAGDADATEQPGGDEAAAKPKRKRRHNKGAWQEGEEPVESNNASAPMEDDA